MEIAFFFIITPILGDMVAFQLLFAPLVFIKLDMQIARPFIRNFFPFYYLYFGILSLVGLALSLISGSYIEKITIGLCAIGFVISRQFLMPLANNATDNGNKKRFDLYHRATVLINTLQLIGLSYLIFHIA